MYSDFMRAPRGLCISEGLAENPWAGDQPTWRSDHPRLLLWQRGRQAGIQGIQSGFKKQLLYILSFRTLSTSYPSFVQWAEKVGRTWRTQRRTSSCSPSGCTTSTTMGQSVWWVVWEMSSCFQHNLDIEAQMMYRLCTQLIPQIKNVFL